MANDSLRCWFGRPATTRELPGDRIKVNHGLFAESQGVLVGFTAQNKCLLRLDGLEEGVFVLATAAELQLRERRSEAPLAS